MVEDTKIESDSNKNIKRFLKYKINKPLIGYQ